MTESHLAPHMPAAAVMGVYRGGRSPLSFGDAEGEFRSALDGAAVCDHSMFGRIDVTGADGLDLLNRLSTNALSHLTSGGIAQTVFVTEKGRVIDSVSLCVREDGLFLITSPGAEQVLSGWIEKFTITEDVRLRTITDDTVMLSLLGSRAVSGLRKAAGVRLPEQGCLTLTDHGVPFSIVLRRIRETECAHLIAPAGSAGALMDLAGATGARWIGAHAWEAYRISHGIPASPGELSGAHTPLECGLRDSVSFTKGCYIGQEVIARLDTYGKLRRRLHGVSLAQKVQAELPTSLSADGREAGMLTSAAEIPFGGRYAGLAILRDDCAGPGAVLEGVAGTVATCTVAAEEF